MEQVFGAGEIIILYKSANISDLEKDALLNLYQPIISGDVVSLYLSLLLWQETARKDDNLLNADLLKFTNHTPTSFIEARRKLEGIGLMDVYEKYSATFGKVFTYVLHPPKKASLFFQDLMLMELLLGAIGQNRLDRLVEKYSLQTPDLSEFQKVTKSYQEVFGHKTANVLSQTEKIYEIQGKTAEKEPEKLDVSAQSQFDLLYFRHLLSTLNITLREEDVENIFLYHNLFGINELEMSDFARQASSIGDEFLDMFKLKQRIKSAVDSGQVKKIISHKTQILPADIRRAQLLKSGFSEQDCDFIIESEQRSPMDFLRFIQEKRGTSSTPLEDSIVEKAVANSKLSNQAINMLIYYILIAKNYSDLSLYNGFNRGINRWELEKIATSEQAMLWIEKDLAAAEQKAKTNQGNKNFYGGKKGKVEEIPDYIKNPKVTPQEDNKGQSSSFQDMLKAFENDQ